MVATLPATYVRNVATGGRPDQTRGSARSSGSTTRHEHACVSTDLWYVGGQRAHPSGENSERQPTLGARAPFGSQHFAPRHGATFFDLHSTQGAVVLAA